MNKAKTESKLEQVEGVIEEYKQLQAQVAELQSANKKLNDELKKTQADMKIFEPYREFVTEATPKVWVVELKDKHTIDNIRKLELKIYQGQPSVLKQEQEDLSSIRAFRMNKLVEKMIGYVCRDVTSMNLFIQRMIREPGDNA